LKRRVAAWDGIETVGFEREQLAARRRRRNIIIAAVEALLIAVVARCMMTRGRR
jgi:hypothetical protein